MDMELRRKVCRLIAGLVVVDNDLAPEEDAFIEHMLKGFDIPLAERDSIFPIIDRDEAAAEMRSFPEEVQDEAMGMLAAAAAADGVIADDERDYLRVAFNACGVGDVGLSRRLDEALAARAKAQKA